MGHGYSDVNVLRGYCLGILDMAVLGEIWDMALLMEMWDIAILWTGGCGYTVGNVDVAILR